MKGAQHLHCGSYKTLKAIGEDLNRWKAFSMRGLEDGIVEMTVFPRSTRSTQSHQNPSWFLCIS